MQIAMIKLLESWPTPGTAIHTKNCALQSFKLKLLKGIHPENSSAMQNSLCCVKALSLADVST